MCKEDIGDFGCHLNFLLYELLNENEYKDKLTKILQSCEDISYCSNQFLFLFEKPKIQDEKVQNERYKKSQEYYDRYNSLNCNSKSFYSFLLRDCALFVYDFYRSYCLIRINLKCQDLTFISLVLTAYIYEQGWENTSGLAYKFITFKMFENYYNATKIVGDVTSLVYINWKVVLIPFQIVKCI